MHAGFRDAIHVPFIVVACDTMLEPGDKVSLRHRNKCVKWTGKPEVSKNEYGDDNEPMWHGVVDPFLSEPVPAMGLFRLMLRPECFTELRHVFEIEVHDRGGTNTCHSVCNIW